MSIDTVEDMDIINQMLTEALKYGLTVEVVKSFGEYRAAGDTVGEAARGALYDWDI